MTAKEAREISNKAKQNEDEQLYKELVEWTDNKIKEYAENGYNKAPLMAFRDADDPTKLRLVRHYEDEGFSFNDNATWIFW